MKIRRAIVILVLTASLAGCGVVNAIKNGLAYSKAVEADLARSTGVKPGVGFKWHNGSLETVTVTFPRLYTTKPLDELGGTVREVVAREFKETPDKIVLAFEMEK
jgi:hypothetical protein